MLDFKFRHFNATEQHMNSILFSETTYIEEKTFLISMEPRQSQSCPLGIGWALAKSYCDLFYTSKTLPYLTARRLTKFSS